MAYGNIAVLNTATKILSANALRKNYAIFNYSRDDIFIGQDASVTTANGFPILGAGGWSEEVDANKKAWIGEVWAISSVATTDVRYWETIE